MRDKKENHLKVVERNKSEIIKKWDNYTFKLYQGNTTKTHIFYNYFNPITGKNERVKTSIGLTALTGVKLIQEATKLVDDIIELLKKGWNPIDNKIVEETDISAKSSIIECLENFLEYRKDLVNKGLLSKNRLVNNTIFYNYFKEWLLENNYPNKVPQSFNEIHLQTFLNHYKVVKKWNSKNTYNEYRSILILFFNYLLKKKVILINEAENTTYASGANHDQTHYTVFEDDELKNVIDKLKNDVRYRDLHLAGKMLYNLMIRPNELLKLQFKFYNPSTKVLFLPKDITKNGNDAFIQVDEETHNLLTEFNFSPEYYIIGRSMKKLAFGYLGQKWRKFRAEYNIPSHLKFYALKHTSSYNFLQDDVEGFKELSERLRHATERTTRKYVDSKLKKKVITPLRTTRF